eukprot:TCONS_00036505-protein
MGLVKSQVTELATLLEKITVNTETLFAKFSALEKSVTKVNNVINSISTRLEKVENQNKIIFEHLEDIKDNYVTKENLSSELSSEILSLSQKSVNLESFSLILFEICYAIEQQKMTTHLEICFQPQSILKRHNSNFSKETFMQSIEELETTSLLLQESPTISSPP